LFMVNEIEAHLLTKKEGVKPQLRTIKKLGPKMVIVTEGAEGAGFYNGKEFLYIKPHRVKVVEVTGAGDAFGASFVAGLIRKPNNVRFALKLALINAESVIRRHGAHAGLLTYEKAVEAMIKPTRIIVL